MLVVKFGGTSVGKPERMKKIADLVLGMSGRKIVVLSALSGTTNTLVKMGDHLLADRAQAAQQEIIELENHYRQFVQELFHSTAYLAIGQEIVSRYFSLFRLLAAGTFDDRSYRELLAQGELLSTELFYHHLQERKVNARLLPALHFMSIDENQEPELEKIGERLRKYKRETKHSRFCSNKRETKTQLNFALTKEEQNTVPNKSNNTRATFVEGAEDKA